MPKAGVCRELPGWRWVGAKLETVDSVRALLERGATIKGLCKTDECRRRVSVDLRSWWEHGYGEIGVQGLLRAYRCARVGCDLTLELPYYPSGVPLAFYLSSEDRLDVRCHGCKAGKLLTAEEFIARLERAGVTYAGNVGIRVAHEFIRGACKACGRARWTVELVSPPAPGTPQWAKAHGIGGARS